MSNVVGQSACMRMWALLEAGGSRKADPFREGKAKSSRSGPYSGRWRTRQFGEKLGLRHRVERAQRVGLIMVVLALAIIVVKHYEADVTLDAKVLFMQVPLLFGLRDSGSVEGVLITDHCVEYRRNGVADSVSLFLFTSGAGAYAYRSG